MYNPFSSLTHGRVKNACYQAVLFLFAISGSTSGMAQRPIGIDVSHWQGTGINWTSVKNSGVTFAWCKATEGTGYIDATFTLNEANAKSAGVLIGAYHFARYDLDTGTNGAALEAAHFWNTAKNYIKGTGTYMMPMLDLEANTTGYTKTTLSQWANQWCLSVSNSAAAVGVTVKPVIYISRSRAGTWMDSTMTKWTPWIAEWNNQDPQTGAPAASTPWSTWTFWQYTDAISTPGAGTVDGDVFHGTAATLGAYIIGGYGAPTFTSEPSNRQADQGSSLTMRVSAAGATPLKYQWRFKGTNIPSATNTTYTLTNIQLASAGNYTVIVTNSYGSITSSVAKLTVNPLYAPVFSDNFDVNSSANWTLNRSSTDTRAIFAYDYTGIGVPVAPNTTNGTKKGLRFEANLTAGVAAALNVSPIGQSFSGDYRLHFDMWINANGPFPLGGTGSTEHLTAGVGTAGNRVQWNSGTSDGSWFGVDGEGQASDASPDIRAYIGTALQTNTAGVYVGGTASNVRRCSHPYYSNVFPGGQTAPATQKSAYAQQTGNLDTGTFGMAWRDVVISKTNNTVEWFIDGLKIATVTNTLTANNIFVGYWDSFASLSDNTNLSFGLIDNLRVEVPAVAPNISAQPTDLMVNVGSTASFSVTTSGTAPFSYQWRSNSVNIVGATNSIYSMSNVQPEQAGSYSVVVSNAAGSATSSDALLTVTQMQATNFSLNESGVFQMTIHGAPGSGYNIFGSTNLNNWQLLGTFDNPSGTFQFTDIDSTNFPQRFYRISAP